MNERERGVGSAGLLEVCKKVRENGAEPGRLKARMDRSKKHSKYFVEVKQDESGKRIIAKRDETERGYFDDEETDPIDVVAAETQLEQLRDSLKKTLDEYIKHTDGLPLRELLIDLFLSKDRAYVKDLLWWLKCSRSDEEMLSLFFWNDPDMITLIEEYKRTGILMLTDVIPF